MHTFGILGNDFYDYCPLIVLQRNERGFAVMFPHFLGHTNPKLYY
jgi:hypothetical protein